MNKSKQADERFWRRWRASGAVSKRMSDEDVRELRRILLGMKLRMLPEDDVDPQPGLVLYLSDDGEVVDITVDDGPLA